MSLRETFAENKKLRTGAMAAAALLVLGIGTGVYMYESRPYALAVDGSELKEAYTVNIDENQVALVETQEQGEEVISEIRDYYVKDQKHLKSVTIKQDITIGEAELKRGLKAEHPACSKVEDVVDIMVNGTTEKKTYTVKKGDTASEIAEANAVSLKSLKKWNKQEDVETLDVGDELNLYEKDPMVDVTTVETITYTKKIKFKTKKVKTSKLYEGETKVKRSGSYGKRKYTAEVTRVNGERTKKKVVATKVLKKPKSQIILIGTREKPPAGQNVVDYAMQFLGNPYAYGGTSLTGGADCSGFTMAIYAHFGYGLPHNSYAQLGSGRPVSYGDAKPGDLIIYPNHVAIYAGGGMIIHAANPRQGIIYSSAGGYGGIIGVRRIIN